MTHLPQAVRLLASTTAPARSPRATPASRLRWRLLVALVAGLPAISAGCSSEPSSTSSTPSATTKELNWNCEVAPGAATPDFLSKTGCLADFQALASEPLDASIPGARSGKVVLDLLNGNTLYYQNSNKYPIHYQFAKAHLNGTSGSLAVGTLADFNPQYTAPLSERRFLLGAVTYYEQPKIWALEIAPYDTSTPEMIFQLYQAVAAQAYYGPALRFHPTSESVESQAKKLGSKLPIVTTDQLFAAIDYQPLNIGETVGQLKIVKSTELDDVYLSARDIVVLDAVPNDIAPVAGIITEQFQTPLSHINVLARNRGTPNMGLRKATTDARITKLKGKSVRLTVGAFEWKLQEITTAESDAWWNAHKPPAVTLPAIDTSVTDLRDITLVTEHTDTAPYVTLDAIKAAIRTFGAKAANYSVFSTDPLVPHKRAFAIPVYYYDDFMKTNGFYARIEALRADPTFTGSQAVRDQKLAELRTDMLKTNLSAAFLAQLKTKLDKDFAGGAMRFRSSTNAEDLDGFPCAGCYDSHTGDPADFAGDQVLAAQDAIRRTWATAWNLRTYEERELHGIAHNSVAMALLVHTSFPDEEANGVAITNNIFDASGNAPGFYVNVQQGGEAEVVHPPAGVTSDSFLYQFSFPNQPIIYYTRSNLIPATTHVLTDRQIHDLGTALDAIHTRFANAYRPADPNGWYAMDCEFKFDDEANPGATPSLYLKQARPYPGSAK